MGFIQIIIHFWNNCDVTLPVEVNVLMRLTAPSRILTLGVLFSHGWWVVMVPVHSVVICEHHYMTLSLPLLGAGHHGWNHQLLQVGFKLPTSSIIGQLMQQST